MTRKEREMRIKVNGVELCVETFGNPADPPVLLVGVTMLSWPDELCAALAGRYVVRYDLRDAGQSTFVDPDTPAYDLRDLVTDASELLVALDLGRTHVVGMGVGGPSGRARSVVHDGHSRTASYAIPGSVGACRVFDAACPPRACGSP